MDDVKRKALRKGDEADRNAEPKAEDAAYEERIAMAYPEAEAGAIEAADREEFARLRRAPGVKAARDEYEAEQERRRTEAQEGRRPF
jgi:hypothetical protein